MKNFSCIPFSIHYAKEIDSIQRYARTQLHLKSRECQFFILLPTKKEENEFITSTIRQ